MEKIASFRADHRKIVPGIYLSRTDGDVATYDLRVKKPNAGDYMSHIEMHTTEHLFATFIRNSEIGQHVVYFGPMGCRTGFYLLTRGVAGGTVLRLVKDTLRKICSYEGPVFGASEEECGNYRELDLAAAKKICGAYLKTLETLPESEWSFSYPI